jgi:hypothetical protein
MLIKKTVFVLGAGASVDYGFPTGLQLSQYISTSLAPSAGPRNQLRQLLDLPDEEIGRFRDDFYYSGNNSVDAFLEHRSEYMRIGKAAIALALIPREDQDRLFRYDTGWLRYLYARLKTAANFESNRLSIITFNYDRSVEHFLFTCLKKSYSKSDAGCRRILTELPIIHLHGRLGFLPWQDKPTMSRAYDGNLTLEALQTSIENIRIVHEDMSDGREDFEHAKALLKEAEQIVFFGFGYDKTNLNRLDVQNLNQTAIGTAIGLGAQERAQIARSWNKINLQEGDCLFFMRERVVWD